MVSFHRPKFLPQSQPVAHPMSYVDLSVSCREFLLGRFERELNKRSNHQRISVVFVLEPIEANTRTGCQIGISCCSISRVIPKLDQMSLEGCPEPRDDQRYKLGLVPAVSRHSSERRALGQPLYQVIVTRVLLSLLNQTSGGSGRLFERGWYASRAYP